MSQHVLLYPVNSMQQYCDDTLTNNVMILHERRLLVFDFSQDEYSAITRLVVDTLFLI